MVGTLQLPCGLLQGQQGPHSWSQLDLSQSPAEILAVQEDPLPSFVSPARLSNYFSWCSDYPFLWRDPFQLSPQGIPSPEPLKDLAISIAAEDLTTGHTNAGWSLHNNKRALQCRGNCSSSKDTDDRTALAHLCHLPAEPLPLSQLDLLLSSSQALSSVRGDFLFLATSCASQSSCTSRWSGCFQWESLTLSGLSLEHPQDLACCRKIYPPPHQPCIGWGGGSLHWDVTLYPKGTVHHTAVSVLCRPWHVSLHLTLGHHFLIFIIFHIFVVRLWS
jgi:hypothetical protein